MTNQICTLCGYSGEAKKKNKGNGLIELILWFFFIIPGIIYSIWRRADKQNLCPKCNNASMIPLDTPMGQKLMVEQKSNPDMQIQPEKTEVKKSPSVWAILLIIVGGVAFVVMIDNINNSPSNTDNATINSVQAPAIKVELPVEPQARIEAIVKNLGANYEVIIFGKNPNKKPIAPFEIIINTDAGSCAFAKQMNFDVMKALYTDEISNKNIARVRFNARKYLSTSLGGDDAKESTSKTWSESGPTNFLVVLTQMGSGDLSYKDIERQTWGSPMEGCK